MSATSYGLVVAGWLAGLVLLWRLRTPPATTVTGLAARVSVVVPARNEARSLPRLLASLAAQVEPPLEVLVVDDGSDDGTADIARAASVGVLDAGPPPAGWLGKPWACQQGVAAASGDLLLFLDADTWLAPDGVARLAAVHEARASHGLLSVQPFHRVERPYEQLSAVCNVVPVLASAMAVPGDPRPSVAFGPCLLARADALAAVGGFDAVRGEIVEDAALARAFRGDGRPVRCLGGGRTVAFRMYPDGLGSLVEGWTKNLAGGAAGVAPVALVGAALWVTAGLSVTVDAVTDPTVAVAVAWAAIAVELWWMLRRLGSFHWLTSVLFPIPLLAFVGLFVRSLVLRLARRPVTWRGRRIDPSRLMLPLLVDLSFWGTLLANIVAWAAFHAGSGYVAHRLPLARLQHDGWLLRPRHIEAGGRAYARRFHIQRWKDRLPEAGAFFEGGISKRHVSRDLDRFVAETRRAEYGHWLAIACSPAFALWNPLSGLVLMTVYSVLVNAPFIAVQRYNRQRAQRILARR